jgi:hypothetical protein
MRNGSRRGLWLLVLAAAMAMADGRARSQAPATAGRPAAVDAATARPFQIRQSAYVKASNPGMGDHFGCGGFPTGHTGNALAISNDGSTMAVGAPHESSGAKGVNGNQNDDSMYGSGAVYVFTRRGDSWAQQAYIKASNPRQSAHFGSYVALSSNGNTLAVAAHFEPSAAKGVNGDQNDESIPEAGAVYVFTRTGTRWAQQAYLKASNTGRASSGAEDDFGDGDQFGFAIALNGDGNTLAASAISEDSRASNINTNDFQNDDSAPSSGAVYVFTRNGATWSQQAYIKSSNSEAGDLFGYDIGLSGDGNTLAVAGYDEDGSGKVPNAIPDNRRNGSGAIYVFERAGNTWRQTGYLKGSRSQSGDSVGTSMALSYDGSTIAAGAGDENCMQPGVNPAGCDVDEVPDGFGTTFTTGAVYVWARNGNAWVEQAFLKSSNPNLFDWFGGRLAVSGDGNTVAVAAQNEDGSTHGFNGYPYDNSAEDAGAVYVFTRSNGAWTQQAYVKSSNAEEFDEFGTALALNGDGKLLAVGARGEGSAAKGVNGNQQDNSLPGAGAVYVFAIN